MQPVPLKWNDSVERFRECDAYFLVGGFSYEDRGRSGMISARDPIMDILREEAEKGKVILGHCNGAQILVESGLIPLGHHLSMSLAHNAITTKSGVVSPGFLNKWVHITSACKKDRCASSDWQGVMQIPIAHGEGRFITRDPDLLQELIKNDQIAFRYCDAEGTVSEDPSITCNGSLYAIAGLCNPAGNIVALMPHPERTTNGDPYFTSVKRWIENGRLAISSQRSAEKTSDVIFEPQPALSSPVEIFIDTLITNNEERTVEQALRHTLPTLTLKQYRYIAPRKKKPEEILQHISLFNPHKEVAYVQQDGSLSEWNAASKTLVPTTKKIFQGVSLLRRDDPDTAAHSFGEGSMTGICYDCRGVQQKAISSPEILAMLGNPHASTLMTHPA